VISAVEKNFTRYTLGVSSCLLGEATRFNGNHKLSRYVRDTVGSHFVLEPVCPEVAIGLGTPRAPVRLIASDAGVRVVDSSDSRIDHTDALWRYGTTLMERHPHWCGFVGAAKSPSCGVQRTKVYRGGAVTSHADGMVVQALRAADPCLPIEDEGRLNDAALRENFILRVHIYAAWKQMMSGNVRAHDLLQFWSRHKFLVLAHSQSVYRKIGPLLANLKTDVPAMARVLIVQIMHALERPATRSNHVNVLQHLQGFVKQGMSADDKNEWMTVLESYRSGHVPLSVPVTLLNSYVRRGGGEYVRAQAYWQPYPSELGLRNATL
jgi:uncharacterized protein YbgA (DUF1722 family)/uncharacterized protein YbbK (DUF523 family)